MQNAASELQELSKRSSVKCVSDWNASNVVTEEAGIVFHIAAYK